MKKIFNLQKTIISLLILSLMVLPFLSCKFSDNQIISENEKTVLVGFNTVLPDEYTTSSDRSAIPEFSNNTLRYDVSASYTENGTTNTITRNGFDTVPFYLPLIPEKNYTITVEAYDRSDTTKATLFKGSIQNISVDSIITDQNGPFTIPLELYKVNGNITSGNGSLDLQFIVDYASSQGWIYKYSLSGNGITPITNNQGQGASRNTPFPITIDNIPSNSNPYDFVVTFKAGTNIVYQFHTDVMIFAGATTNTWKNEQELGSGENSNIVVITQELVDAYTSKYFYVKNDSEITDNGQGTYESPWRNLKSAFNKIKEVNDGISIYRVYILGDLTGSYELNNLGVQSTYYPGKVDDFELPSSYTKDLHILIQGIGSTKPILNSDFTSPEISITNSSNKTVILELKNIACAHEINVENVDIALTNTDTADFTSEGGDAELTNVETATITVTDGNATLENVQATTSISVSGGDATLTTVTSGAITVDGNAILDTVTATGNITVTNGTATFTDVTTSGNISVTNGNVIFNGVNAEATSSSITITTSGGSVHLADIHAGTINSTISTGNAELDDINSNTISITIPTANANGTATLENVQATTSITVSGGNATLRHINDELTTSSATIDVTGGNATLTTVKSGAITVDGNATLNTITATGDIEVTVEATLTHVTTSGDITVGGDANLEDVQAAAIEVSDGDAELTNVTASTGISITHGDSQLELTSVTASEEITLADGNIGLSNVTAGNVTISTDKDVVLSDVTATAIEVNSDNATLTNIDANEVTVTSTGAAELTNITSDEVTVTSSNAVLTNTTSGEITLSGGQAELTGISGNTSITANNCNVTIVPAGTGSITTSTVSVTNGNASLTRINAGSITITNGDAELTNVTASTGITITHGNSQLELTSVTASEEITLADGNIGLSNVTAGNVTISTDKDVVLSTFTATAIEVTNGNNVKLTDVTADTISVSKGTSTSTAARLYNVTSPDIDFTGVDITLIGVTSSPAPATGNNITLDSGCTIKLGGKTGFPNTIGRINLPKNTSDQQIKFQILNTDTTDNSELTLDNSRITFTSETVPTAANQYILFTDGFSASTNTSQLACEIFTNADSFATGQIETSSSTYEGCIALSSGSVTINYLDNITFSVDKTEVESKALNATDEAPAGSSFTMPSGYTGSPRTITVSAQKDGQAINISDITSLSLKLISTQVSGGNSVIESSNTNTITVPYGIPAGQYILRALGFYNDGTNTAGYSSDFTITVTDTVQFAASKTMLLKSGTAEEKTLSIFGSHGTNILTLAALDATTTPFTITTAYNGSASVVLSADSPTCGSYTVNVYGYYTLSGEQIYFRDVIPINVGEFIFEFKKNTTVVDEDDTISISSSDTGDNRKIRIDAKLHVSSSTADDVNLNSEAEVHVVRVTESGTNVSEEELYVYNDISITSSEIVYTVPTSLATGNYRIYLTVEYNGISKTITRDLTLTD